MKIAVLNGPSLNLLGTREPNIYGTDTLADIERRVARVAGDLDVNVVFSQHNSEGGLVDAIHAAHGSVDGILINAAAYTHTSLAVADALRAVGIPYVEVHLSNIFAREAERRHSMLAAASVGLLCGFGSIGYELGLRGLVASLAARNG